VLFYSFKTLIFDKEKQTEITRAFDRFKAKVRAAVAEDPTALGGHALMFSEPVISVTATQDLTLDNVESSTAAAIPQVGSSYGLTIWWHFARNPDPLRTQDGKHLVPAAKLLLVLLFYKINSLFSKFLLLDRCPIVDCCLVKNKSSAIQTGFLISNQTIIKACRDWYCDASSILGAPSLALGRATLDQVAIAHLAHPSHLKNQTYLSTFIDKLSAAAVSLAATPKSPTFDLLSLRPPADPDASRRVRFLFFFFVCVCYCLVCSLVQSLT